ncbi:MAG: monovalent cation/H(+) antiporter subunit G [Verrucomicrobiae bacterium]|nr:monovalent cation/H(+) antiporter subunit G [Verrucomicrobiae bacterium]
MNGQLIRELIALVAILVGTGFAVLGIVGMLRLPDLMARLHATGKVATFGVVFLLVATALLTPYGWSRAMVLMVSLIIAGPVLSHAIAAAAWRRQQRATNQLTGSLENP